jgi:archaellum biogenesis ATPase FlaH
LDTNKQTLLIEYLVSSTDTFALCSGIVDPNYFDPELRNSVTFIKDYYENYNATPDPDQIKAETGVVLSLRDVKRDQIDYCATEIEQFCKRRAIEKAIINAPKLIQAGEYGDVEEIIKDAITISLHRDLGLSLFDNPYDVLMRLKNEDSTVTTGWQGLDDVLGGGMRRKEMILFSANSGGGKSITMANLGLNLMERGMNVLYISLELSEELIAKRFYGMISGVNQVEILPKATEVAHIMEKQKESHGDLLIKRMSTGTCANDVRALLKEIELTMEYVPDAIIMDYLDLMGPNGNVHLETFEKDKASAEQLRDLGEDYNMFVITASQQNRGAVDAVELNHSHIAGGISKINTTDVYISIIMTDQMRAEGIMKFQMLKTRSSDGVGKMVDLCWDSIGLRISDSEETRSKQPKPLQLNKKSDKQEDSGGGNLMSFFD